MAKPLKWTGKTGDNTEITGEGYDDNDCRLRAESQGCVEFRVEENPDYTVTDEIAELTPEVVHYSGKDAQGEDSLQHLALANAKMFEQLNSHKNAANLGKDLAHMFIAWHSGVIAKAADLEDADKETISIIRALADQVVAA